MDGELQYMLMPSDVITEDGKERRASILGAKRRLVNEKLPEYESGEKRQRRTETEF